MVVMPRSGSSGEALHQTLNEVYNTAMNAGSGPRMVDSYLAWASEAVRMLRMVMRPQDLERLVLTPRYWATLANPTQTQAVAIAVSDEVLARQTALQSCAYELRQELAQWDSAIESLAIVVPDTNVFLHHDELFDEIDWHGELSATVRPMQMVRLVIPLLVIDELDNNKRSDLRSRAGGTLKLLYSYFESDTGARHTLADAANLHGAVTVQLLLDEPHHERLTRPDDELIDRAVALQALINRPVEFVSYDTGAVFRAKAAGLRGHRLVH